MTNFGLSKQKTNNYMKTDQLKVPLLDNMHVDLSSPSHRLARG